MCHYGPTSQLDTMGNVTGKAKVIVPLANACPETAVNVNWLMTIFMYNMTGKPATKEILTEIGDNVNRAVEPVRPCLLAHPVIEMDMGWASALGETDWTTPGGVYQAIGGGSEMLTINRMRAYWSYLIGPPRDAYLTLAVAGIAGAIRMQINSTAI
ncbi:hypothetical protein HYH02_005028 [Chlamydomonas schloesseri]|uniref:Uncharacterized protein n=1 Tax=Chlamydomonas schloesseri TaxID=2026947 RepID=A0A835WNC4_9CHLO|nr:hypothetical protein HYH02_005028 [Chlamydomonas schloesseri]|eukprot:KAG2450527.1 hypothetical protein HYH02_005028 [Chlamydomonas schloesseri]